MPSLDVMIRREEDIPAGDNIVLGVTLVSMAPPTVIMPLAPRTLDDTPLMITSMDSGVVLVAAAATFVIVHMMTPWE
jgi:hypothetical protein